MDHSVALIRFWLKRGLAMGLFIALLLGASATAFYALAAGITALSGFSASAVNAAPTTFITPSAVPVTSVPATANNGGPAVSAANSTPVSQPSATSTATSALTTNLASNSVTAAIDGGGFVLGNRIEQSVGSVLGGVLSTLFLDRSTGTSQSTGGPSVQTSSATAP